MRREVEKELTLWGAKDLRSDATLRGQVARKAADIEDAMAKFYTPNKEVASGRA